VTDEDTTGISSALKPPEWLRDMGTSAWLMVGVILLGAGIVAILALTSTIVLPLIAATVIAVVAGPLVSWLNGHGVPRVVGAILLLLALILVAVLVIYTVIKGITNETDGLKQQLDGAKEKIQDALGDLGVDSSTAQDATDEASSTSTDAVHELLHGIAVGLGALASLAFFLAMTVLSLIFLLTDGPKIRAWGERHLGVPLPVARTITGRTMESLRGYFLGTTIVAGFNAVVVGLGAWILGIPLAGSIAVITFFAAYVPYLGAWTAGAFSVLLALGGAGTDAAVGMIVIQILANGVLQQLVQPFAMGTALGIHPLAVLVSTIAGGALFGTIGLILAAPIVSAITRISADLTGAGAAEEARGPAPAAEVPAT
jgi:putative heme transporter